MSPFKSALFAIIAALCFIVIWSYVCDSKHFEQFWVVTFDPPEVAEFGLAPRGLNLQPFYPILKLSLNGGLVSGTAKWSYSDCGLGGGGPVNGIYSNGLLLMQFPNGMGGSKFNYVFLGTLDRSTGIISGNVLTIPGKRFAMEPRDTKLKGGMQNALNAAFKNDAMLSWRAALTAGLSHIPEAEKGTESDYRKMAEKFSEAIANAENMDDFWKFGALAISWNNLGNCYYYRNLFPEAESAYRKAAENAPKANWMSIPYGAELEILFDLKNSLRKQNKQLEPTLEERIRSLQQHYSNRNGPWVQWLSPR